MILRVIELHRRVATRHHSPRATVRQAWGVHGIFPVIPPRPDRQQPLPVLEGDAIALIGKRPIGTNPLQRVVQLPLLGRHLRMAGGTGLGKAGITEEGIQMPTLVELKQTYGKSQCNQNLFQGSDPYGWTRPGTWLYSYRDAETLATAQVSKRSAHSARSPGMLVTIARYSLPYEAHLARSRLDAEDIPAFIADEHTINMQWLWSDALGGIRLQVPEPYVQAALAILAEDREQTLLETQEVDVATCPHCGSTNTEYQQIGRRWAFLVFIGLHFPLFPVRHGIRCRQCGKVSPA